jgi:hypothetical protein
MAMETSIVDLIKCVHESEIPPEIYIEDRRTRRINHRERDGRKVHKKENDASNIFTKSKE